MNDTTTAATTSVARMSLRVSEAVARHVAATDPASRQAPVSR